MSSRFKIKDSVLLNVVTVLVIVFLAAIAWSLTQRLDVTNGILLILFGFGALKIVYELTLNRDKVPALNTGFFERYKIAGLLQKDAADKPAYTLFDLGSGGGALTRLVGRKIPQAQIIGFEIARMPLKQARIMQKVFGPKNIEYRAEDFMKIDCEGANAVTLFLTAAFAKHVGEKLYKELKPGAMVISNEFALQDSWKPSHVITLYTPFKGTLFVYRR